MGMDLEDWELSAHRIPITKILGMAEVR
jgi:hypothetical protein